MYIVNILLVLVVVAAGCFIAPVAFNQDEE